MDEIDLRDISKVIEEFYSSNSKFNNNSEEDGNNQPTFINKVTNHNTKGIEELCKAYIKNK